MAAQMIDHQGGHAQVKATVTFECIHIMLCLKEGKYHFRNHVENITMTKHHELSTEQTKVEKCPINKNGKHIFLHT